MTKAEPCSLLLHKGQFLWMLSPKFVCLIAVQVLHREGKGAVRGNEFPGFSLHTR